MNSLDIVYINRLAPYKNTYNRRDDYVMQTAEVQEGDTKNFAALIVQKSNPRLQEIIAEFDETINILTNKPE